MSTPATQTYGEIYVTLASNGTPRYSRYAGMQMRLFPVSRAVAEASMAAGATIYRKQAGMSIWQAGGAEIIAAPR